MSYILVFTTTSNDIEAIKLKDEILKNNLAACVSFSHVKSHYMWKNEIKNQKEIKLEIKTKYEVFEKLKKLIISLHSYDVPEIVAIPILESTNEYFNFIDEALKEKNVYRN